METFKSILMRKIAQLPSDDFTVVCVTIIIFLLTVVLTPVFSDADDEIILWLTIALIWGLWYICILEII